MLALLLNDRLPSGQRQILRLLSPSLISQHQNP
jgi:hypothetical protein